MHNKIKNHLERRWQEMGDQGGFGGAGEDSK
jgi:hypothetical protein